MVSPSTVSPAEVKHNGFGHIGEKKHGPTSSFSRCHRLSQVGALLLQPLAESFWQLFSSSQEGQQCRGLPAAQGGAGGRLLQALVPPPLHTDSFLFWTRGHSLCVPRGISIPCPAHSKPLSDTGTKTSTLQTWNMVLWSHTALVFLPGLGSTYLVEELQGKGLSKHPRVLLWRRRETQVWRESLPEQVT